MHGQSGSQDEKQTMTKLDINAERLRLQGIFDNPGTDLERCIKRDWLDKGSEPREWSDETVSSAHWVLRVYETGYHAGCQLSSRQSTG
jgi:hypothetical protein